MRKAKKIFLVIIFLIIGFFASALGYNLYWQYTDPDGYKTQTEYWEKERQEENQKLQDEKKQTEIRESVVDSVEKYSDYDPQDTDDLKIIDDTTESIYQYRITKEILNKYSTMEILEHMTDNKFLEIDDRIIFHSENEIKKGSDFENIEYRFESIKYELTFDDCDYDDLLKLDLQYIILSGYGYDPTVLDLLDIPSIKQHYNKYC